MESGTFEWCWICACLQSPQSFNWLQSNVPALGGGDWPIWELLQLFGSANVWICQPPCIYSAFNKKLKNLSVITPKRRMCRLLSLPTETFHAPLFWSSFSSERKLYLPWKSCLALWLLFQLNTKKTKKKTRKHNGSLEQMVKICNQSLIVTWLLVLLFWKCCSLISLKKKKENEKNLDLPTATTDPQCLHAPLFISSFSR